MIPVFSLVFFVCTIGCSNDGRSNELDQFVIEEMNRRRIPGLALAIIENAKVTVSRSYGFANLETQTPVPRDSIFEIASLTKPLTAVAVLRLVDEGALALEDSVTKHIQNAPREWPQSQSDTC